MNETTSTVINRRECLLSLLPPIFRSCLDCDAIRYYCGTPFVQESRVYATDGRILVWAVATPELIEACAAVDDPSRKRPSAHSLATTAGPFSLLPIDAPDTSSLEVCPACKGVDRIPVTEDEWELFDEDGLCYECSGTHIKDCFERRFEIDCGVSISAQFAQLFDCHKAILYPSLVAPAASPIRFVGEGFEGLVMPLLPKY